MAKYLDKTRTNLKADSCKFQQGEDAKVRHDRRLQTNLANEENLRNYCKSNGFKFSIHNEGHHWQIRFGKTVLDWYPATAKLIVNKQWKVGIHVHDISQIKSYLNFAKLLQKN